MMTPDRLQELKAYMRVDGDEDDLLISELFAAAVVYLNNAGIPEPEEYSQPYALWKLAAFGLVLGWYDNRTAQVPGNQTAVDTGLRHVINQLKLTGF